MLFGFALLVIVIVAAGIAGLIAGVAPLLVIPIAFLLLVAATVVYIRLVSRTPPVVRERASIEFAEDDYSTLAHRPEHTHGHVERGPTRPPGAIP
jgi:uncharacterized protein (DUF58 family)